MQLSKHTNTSRENTIYDRKGNYLIKVNIGSEPRRSNKEIHFAYFHLQKARYAPHVFACSDLYASNKTTIDSFVDGYLENYAMQLNEEAYDTIKKRAPSTGSQVYIPSLKFHASHGL